jgi:hypothetical protein
MRGDGRGRGMTMYNMRHVCKIDGGRNIETIIEQKVTNLHDYHIDNRGECTNH